MEIRLDGRNALVTGASSGIGRGIAEALAQSGADVAINYRSDEAGAAETARLVRESGRRALIIPADVGDPRQVAAMFRRLDDECRDEPRGDEARHVAVDDDAGLADGLRELACRGEGFVARAMTAHELAQRHHRNG